MLAVTTEKTSEKSQKILFFCIVMPKYWVNNYFAHGKFPEVGQKQKTEKKERKIERKKG